jgi:hypothetical protein
MAASLNAIPEEIFTERVQGYLFGNEASSLENVIGTKSKRSVATTWP